MPFAQMIKMQERHVNALPQATKERCFGRGLWDRQSCELRRELQDKGSLPVLSRVTLVGPVCVNANYCKEWVRFSFYSLWCYIVLLPESDDVLVQCQGLCIKYSSDDCILQPSYAFKSLYTTYLSIDYCNQTVSKFVVNSFYARRGGKIRTDGVM